MLRLYTEEVKGGICSADQEAWFGQIGLIMQFCKGKGVDIGSGGRTLNPKILRVDNSKVVRPNVVADGCHLPFHDQVFDFVMSIHSVEHMDDTKMALLEWIRVCKGCVCLVGPDVRIHGVPGSPGSDPGHKHMYTGSQFFELVQSLSHIKIVKFYSEIDRYPDYVCVFKKEISNLLSTGGDR